MTEDRRQSDEGPQESAGSSDLLDRDGAISAFVEPNADASVAEDTGTPPAQLGTARYVHAAFVGGAVIAAYIAAQFFALVWNQLAAWPLALQYVPQLVRYDEGVRGDVGLLFGAVVGVLAGLRLYRRPKIRTWADEVAAELTKVTWPDRESVTNNTIIVIVATIAATLYVTLLDKFWGFATALIYAQ